MPPPHSGKYHKPSLFYHISNLISRKFFLREKQGQFNRFGFLNSLTNLFGLEGKMATTMCGLAENIATNLFEIMAPLRSCFGCKHDY